MDSGLRKGQELDTYWRSWSYWVASALSSFTDFTSSLEEKKNVGLLEPHPDPGLLEPHQINASVSNNANHRSDRPVRTL